MEHELYLISNDFWRNYIYTCATYDYFCAPGSYMHGVHGTVSANKEPLFKRVKYFGQCI